jgi:hypothetical protein
MSGLRGPPPTMIGLIFGSATGKLYAVHHPDTDAELDNPRWLLIQNDQNEPMRLLKVSMEEYMALGHLGRAQSLVDAFLKKT